MFKEPMVIRAAANPPKLSPRDLKHTERYLDEMESSLVGRLARPTEGGRDNMGALLDLWDKDWESMTEKSSHEGTHA